jgi:Ca-activated chloride channel family protein
VSRRIFIIAIVSLGSLVGGCVGGSEAGLGSPGDDMAWAEGDSGIADDREWNGYDEPDRRQGSRCAKGVRPSELVAVAQGSDPPSGEMRVKDGERVVALPLAETSFDTIVLGTVADTEVRQVFENPFETPIEAVYVFPLPHDAAVDDYAIEVGGRTIRGVMKRRADARAAYEAAREQGYQAGLLEQERPNIFTQNVANIPPGERITVVMHMVGPVTQDRGRFELALPTVVGPRYVPGTDAVPDGSRISPKVLPEGYVGCSTLSVTVEIDPDAPIDLVQAKSHDIDLREADGHTFVELTNAEERLDRDFVLGWTLKTRAPTTSLVLAPDGDDGWFQLTVVPPRLEHAGEPVPRELVFVLDTSGSMDGEPLETSRRAMHGFLSNLGPDDAFTVIRFSSDATALGPKPLTHTEANVRRALRYIARLEGEGGTEMIEGVRAALDFPYTDGRSRYVLFLTDGFIGNEQQIFQAVGARAGDARVFSLGVGSAPNRYLLDGLARAGRGAATYVENHETPADAVAAFYRRLAHPVLTDLEIDWNGLPVDDVVPARIPDLFTGQPVVVYGRMHGVRSGTATLRARAGDREVEIPIRIDVAEARRTGGVASMWARRKIQEHEDSLIGDPGGADRVERAVTELALRHHVMSKYTSFVAIDDSRVVPSDGGPTRVDVPVDLPDGMTTAGLGAEAVYEVAEMEEAEDAPTMASSEPEPEPDWKERSIVERKVSRRGTDRTDADPTEAAERKLERLTKRSHRALSKCYGARADLSRVSVRIQVEIDDRGTIAAVDLTLSGPDDEGIRACLEREVRTWKIPHRAEGRVHAGVSWTPAD